jgi:hypothetical protein
MYKYTTMGTDVRTDRELLQAFLRGKIDGGDFRHSDHVRVGFEILHHHGFPDALAAYCAALKGMAMRAGRPGAYHETITVAFLSLIAERRTAGRYADAEAFIDDSPELMDRTILERWYTPERLFSDIARSTFVMPDGYNHEP